MKDYGEIEGLQKNISTETRAAYDRGYKRGYQDGHDQAKEKYGVFKIAQDTGELMQKEYQRGLNDAWETARTITGMGANGLEACGISTIPNYFDDNVNRMFENYSVSEVMEKLKGYEEKQKVCKFTVAVGDEITITDDDGTRKARVLDIDIDDILYIIDENGCVTTLDPDECRCVVNTGRHFDQIGDLLKLLREDET